MTDEKPKKKPHSGPPPVNRTTFLVLGAVAALAVLGCGGLAALTALPLILASAMGMGPMIEAEDRGKAFGGAHTEAECIDEALYGEMPACDGGRACEEVRARFLQGCLIVAPDDPATCEGVPESTDFEAQAVWEAAFCDEHPDVDPQECKRLADKFPVVCIFT